MRSNAGTDRRTATRQDIASALYALQVLPKRLAIDPTVEFESYVVALAGVSAKALATGVQRVLQASLMHGFFPNPVELRMVCSDLVEAERRAAERERREEQQRIESEAHRKLIAARTDDEKRRVLRRYCDLLEQCWASDQSEKPEAIMQRYDPRKLAKVPDAPAGGQRLRTELQPYAHLLQEER